jgi:hypothetical protein
MTQFVIPNADPVASLTFEKVVAIDLSSFTGVNDYISLALPEFPGEKIDLTQTYFDLTSHPQGDFNSGLTFSFQFADGLFSDQDHGTLFKTREIGDGEIGKFDLGYNLETAKNADTEIRFPFKNITGIDLSSITGVRFRIFATAECEFRCLAIRACDENWQYAPIDLNTLWHRVARPPSPAGSTFPPTDLFPQESLLPEKELQPQNELATAFPEEFPILFRSAETFGITDPEPVNLEVAAVFCAGTFAQAAEGKFNKIGLVFRDIPIDDQTQVEVNSFTQAQLDGLHKQPDFGKALYDARDQADIDIEIQSEIDTTTQFAMERKRDESEHSWIEVLLEWNATQANNKLHIIDADGVGYSFSKIPIEASDPTDLNQGKYMMIVNLQNSTCQVKLYEVDQVGNVGAKVYDTGVLRDNNLIKRRKGRFGWRSSLLDGDAYIESIKTRGTNFGEVISKEFQSITPVKGVSLFAGSTDDKQLVEFFEPASPYTTIELDTSASSTGHAIKVITTPGRSLQGISTNEFRIDEPANLDISFDLKFPTSQVPGGGLSAFLIGEYERVIPMNLTGFKRDTWSHVKVAVPAETIFQTGSYQLVLMQTLPVANAPWWVENLSITTSSVKWSARSAANDPWSDPEERWQPAGNSLNSEQGGIVFEEPGNGLQVRAQTFRQDAKIHNYKAVPQYATLGRMVFEQPTFVAQGAPHEQSRAPNEARTTGTNSIKHEFEWLNPSNILINDTNYATVSSGDYFSTGLYAMNYGFTIPSNATITGIKIQISRKGSYESNGSTSDRSLYMIKNGIEVGNNFAIENTKWPTSLTTQNYGGNGQLFGYPWTPEIINGAATGVVLRTVGGKENKAEVNWIGMTVFYTVPA